ncbi:hypothetical protein EJ03DRAFT_76289 [Teratosphaeria nubilosa]|uniref:Uncharacterized protein n=1 Tax=Teratosphaeria nubilosa TaxID=161662 RepID=A0A6G1LB73_9PEZI|nr:hypothetical protein EJ03DRAFT_76289 [Teratosphaeria nubilosa]
MHDFAYLDFIYLLHAARVSCSCWPPFIQRPPLLKIAFKQTSSHSSTWPALHRASIGHHKSKEHRDVVRKDDVVDRTASVWENQVVLCIDDNGINGFASLVVLEYLVRQIASIERDARRCLGQPAFTSDYSPLFDSAIGSADGDVMGREQLAGKGYLLCHYFDYICGTSTGG